MELNYLNGTSYKVKQLDDMYHFNSDTECLGRFININEEESVLDVGCNQGALMLYAYDKHPCDLWGIDIFPEVIELAKENLELNHVPGNVVCTKLQEFKHEPFDVIICNPPYSIKTKEELMSDNPFIAAARHEIHLSLHDLFMHSKRLLKENGKFFLIHRYVRMDEIKKEANDVGFSISRQQFIYAKKNEDPNCVLFEFKNGPVDRTIELEPIYK